MRTNRENTADIINVNIWNESDQCSVEDMLFESFGRPLMAKDLQNELRAAAFDEKYGDFNEGDEQNQQENPESNRKFLIFKQLNFYKKWLSSRLRISKYVLVSII